MSEEGGPRKKRRRSSLAPSKNKLDLTPSVGRGLHKSIEKSLSAEERIEELCKFCVQCAVDHVSKDCDSDDAKDYLGKVPVVLLECLNKPEMKEARFAACHVGNLQPNPANLEMDMAVQDMEARINRLKTEAEEWNKLFRDLEDKAIQAESLTDKKTISESELSTEQRKLSENYLPPLTDLHNIKTEVSNSIRKTKLLVREHEKCVSNVWKIKEEVSSVLDKKIAELHGKTFGKLESPRTLIQHEFPTPPSEPR